MSYRMVVQERPPTAATVPASAYDLGQKVKAAIAAGLFWFSLVLVIGWALLAVASLLDWSARWELWLMVPGVAFVVGVVACCWLGICWTVQAASRAWEVDDADRARRYEIEDAEEKRQREAAKKARGDVVYGDDHDADPTTFTDAQRLDLVALEIFQRHYLEGQPVSREAMTEAGLCTQPEWNIVNRAFQKIGLKLKRTFREDLDFASVWVLWRESVKVEADHFWTMSARGDWKAMERMD